LAPEPRITEDRGRVMRLILDRHRGFLASGTRTKRMRAQISGERCRRTDSPHRV